MIPDKLQSVDEVRIVAPARSARDIDERVLDRAKAALESLGLKVTFSKNAFSRNQRGCPTDDEKVEDLQEAFMDENVKCVLAAIGGFNSNQMLGKINWQIIKDNPKIFGGFSDITVLNHAILAGDLCDAKFLLFWFAVRSRLFVGVFSAVFVFRSAGRTCRSAIRNILRSSVEL